MSLDLKDVFDHHPDLEPENYLENHHQSYRDLDSSSPYAQLGIVIPLLLTIVAILYHLWFAVDHGLSIPELLWNYLVYMTPTRLIDYIETHRSPLRMADPALRRIPRTHAAKSEAMRSILGLDVSGGIMHSVAQAGRRRLSTIPGINVSSEAFSDRPPGLGNWDNSCYQNSVLQGLASLDSLSEYLTSPNIENRSSRVAARPDMKMAESLRELISTLNDPKNNGKKIWTPVVLKNMSSWQQQDAQEYYSKVLDEIDKEVAAVAYSAQQFQGFESEASPSSSSIGSHPMQFQNPLDGLIAQRVGCTKCGFSEGLSMIPFNCLTVPLRKGWEVDISECLNEYSILEEIEGVECGKCTLLNAKVLLAKLKERNQGSPQNVVYKNISERLDNINEALEEDDYAEKTLSQRCMVGPKSWVTSTKTRQAVIARAPKSLVVHFNRSVFNEMTGELVKNPANVRFPKILDIGPWCLGSSGSMQEGTIEEWQLDPSVPMIASTSRISRLRGPLYELRAVVTHFGRHENGHYICYRKQPVPLADYLGTKHTSVMHQWWRLSDEDVSKVSEEDVLAQGGVFMLFYDLIGSAAGVRQPSVSLSSDVVIKAKITIASEINDATVPRHRSNSPESTSTKTPPNGGNGEFSIYSHPSTLISSQQGTPSIVTRLKDSFSNDVVENTISNIADPEHLPQVQNGSVDFATATLLPNVGGADVLQQGSSHQYLKPQESFLFIAASIPLPDGTDSELTESEYQDSVITAPETSIASSISDYDDDNHDDNHNPNAAMDYKSTETIIVPQPKKDGEEESVERALSPGTLVTV